MTGPTGINNPLVITGCRSKGPKRQAYSLDLSAALGIRQFEPGRPLGAVISGRAEGPVTAVDSFGELFGRDVVD